MIDTTLSNSSLRRHRRRRRRMAEDDAGDDVEGDVGVEWDRFDRLREQHVPTSAPPSDVYRVPSSLASDVFDGRYYDLRHITNINPLLVGGAPFEVFVDSAGAGLMALHHFNNGISDVVPEIKNVTERCRTRFTMDFIDTNFSPLRGSQAFLEDVLERGHRRGGGDDSGAWTKGPDQQQQRGKRRQENTEVAPLPVPSVIVGAARSAVTSPLAILGGVHGVPQISYASTSTALDNRDQYPLFGRVVPSATGDAEAAVSYLTTVLGVTHMGVLYVRDSYGTTYAQALSAAAGNAGPLPLKVRVASFPSSSRTPEARRASISEAIRQLKESGLRYFFGIFFYTDYNEVMAEAMRQGIAGKGYYWMFGDGVQGVADFSYDSETQADVIEATRGMALLLTASPEVLTGKPNFDAFLRHWDDFRAGGEGRSYFDSKMPREFQDAEGGEMLHDYKFTDVKFSTVLLSYDAVISAAFAVCDAEEASRQESGVGEEDGPVRITGDDVFSSFLNVTFDGLFGTVSIDHSTASQVPQTVPFSVSNLLTTPPDENGLVKVTVTTTDVLEAGGDGGSSWRNLHPFTFSDGKTQPLPSLPLMDHNLNLIGTGAHAAGYTMCAIVLLTSLAFSVWTFHNRERRVIKSAQPVFLYILAAGALLMGLAIVPLGVEEPTPQRGLDAACMAAPWLASLGFSLTFAALFAKTLRINMILKKRDMRRIKVEAGQVMKPAAALVGMNALMMAIWTGVAPLRYVRTPVEGSKDEYERSTASFGMCVLPSDPGNPDSTWWVGIMFVALMGVVNGLALVAAFHQIHRARRIETEFSEAKYVKLSVMSMVQAWLIGIPLFFVGRESPQGHYVVMCTTIFIMCQSILLLIFVPKVYFLREWRKKQELRQRERVRKAKTPTWLLNSTLSSTKCTTHHGSVRDSMRNLMQKVKSVRQSGGQEMGGSRNVGGNVDGVGIAAGLSVDSPGDVEMSPRPPVVGFADDFELKETDYCDYNRRISADTIADSQTEEGELRAGFCETRVIMSK